MRRRGEGNSTPRHVKYQHRRGTELNNHTRRPMALLLLNVRPPRGRSISKARPADPCAARILRLTCSIVAETAAHCPCPDGYAPRDSARHSGAAPGVVTLRHTRSVWTSTPPSPNAPSAPHTRSQKQPTTPDPIDGQQVLRITHPFHPLFGREFVLVERRCAWGEERVYFYDETGRLRRLAATWTTAVAPTPFEAVSAGRSHFRIVDLLQLVTLIARQKETKGLDVTSSRKRTASRK